MANFQLPMTKFSFIPTVGSDHLKISLR